MQLKRAPTIPVFLFNQCWNEVPKNRRAYVVFFNKLQRPLHDNYPRQMLERFAAGINGIISARVNGLKQGTLSGVEGAVHFTLY